MFLKIHLAYATNPSLTYSLGPQNSIQWLSNGDDPPAITYDSGERKLHVNMICLSSGEPDSLKVHGYDETTRVYIMILSSKCVCWDGCKGQSHIFYDNLIKEQLFQVDVLRTRLEMD
jgi:hypothetical protein